MDGPPERREAYKNGRLNVSGLLFMVMEAPDAHYPFKNSTDLTINGCDMSKSIDKGLLDKAFVRSLFVNDWNSFIHIAATNAEIFWIDGGAVTYR